MEDKKFIPYCLNKINEIREYSKEVNPALLIEVDGGVDKTNVKEIIAAGANVIVAGSAVFNEGDISDNIRVLRGE